MNPATSLVRGIAVALSTLLLGACVTLVEQPEDPAALVAEATGALERGEYRTGSETYLRAALLAEDESIAEQAARAAFENHQWSILARAADRWLQLNHTNEEARRFAAFAALQLFQVDAAVEHVDTLLSTAYINAPAGFLALLPQLSDEVPAAAVTSVLRRLIDKYPNVMEAHYALAQAALRSDNFALALEHARKARELGPYWSPAGLLLARTQLINEQVDAGLATAREVVEQDNEDSNRLEYALMLLQAGREEEGRKELAELASSESAAAFVERALADLDLQLGNRDAAAKRFANLASSGRFGYESLFYLAAIAEARNAADDAIQLYGRVTSGTFAVAAQTRVARLKVERDGLDAGLAHLEEFADSRPQYRIQMIAARASLLANNGDRAGALKLLDTAIRLYPDAIDLRYARVFLNESSDRVSEAVKELREMVAARPDDPVALNALGYTLVDRTRNVREGRELIERALAQTPDNGAVLDSMGWALHREGADEQALVYLERARQRIADPEVELHIGEVLLSLDRKQDARDTFMRAIERYPDNDDLKRRMQELASKFE